MRFTDLVCAIGEKFGAGISSREAVGELVGTVSGLRLLLHKGQRSMRAASEFTYAREWIQQFPVQDRETALRQ